MIESVLSCWGCGGKGEFCEAELCRKIRTDDGEVTLLNLYFKCSCGRSYCETFQFKWHQGGALPPSSYQRPEQLERPRVKNHDREE